VTTETYSPAEETFNRHRQTLGLIAGPLIAIIILVMPTALNSAAQRVGAVLALMIVLWMTEALPLAVTALLGPTLCVILGVATAQVAYAPFADPVIFLFIGSFILAQGMVAHKLDRRGKLRGLRRTQTFDTAEARPRFQHTAHALELVHQFAAELDCAFSRQSGAQ